TRPPTPHDSPTLPPPHPPPPPPTSTLCPYTTLFRSAGTSRASGAAPSRTARDCPTAANRRGGSAPSPSIAGRLRSGIPRDAHRQIGRAHSELQSRSDLVCRLLLEKKKKYI